MYMSVLVAWFLVAAAAAWSDSIDSVGGRWRGGCEGRWR